MSASSFEALLSAAPVIAMVRVVVSPPVPALVTVTGLPVVAM